jgi:hypothetical protein
LEEKPLGKSHIIPESFFPKDVEDDRPSRLLTNKEGEYPKKLPAGVYDRTILCHSCERKFDLVDNYGQKTLLENEGKHSPITHGGTTYGFELPTYDYNLLKSFFVSVLWRASVSTHPFYGRIRLGPFESIALDLFKSGQFISPESFSVVLAKFDHPIGKSMMCPFTSKFDGLNFCQFYLGGYIAYIKVDKRDSLGAFTEVMLSPGRPLRVISREFFESKEYPLIHKIANAPQNAPNP